MHSLPFYGLHSPLCFAKILAVIWPAVRFQHICTFAQKNVLQTCFQHALNVHWTRFKRRAPDSSAVLWYINYFAWLLIYTYLDWECKGIFVKKIWKIMQKENKSCCFYKGIYILKMYNNLQGVYRMWNKNTWQIAAAERTPLCNIRRWKLFHCVPHARRNKALFAALWVKNVPPPLSTVRQSNWPSGQRYASSAFAHSHRKTCFKHVSNVLVAAYPTTCLPHKI